MFNEHTDFLPDCRTRDTKGRVYKNGITYVPIYCGNCGTSFGGVPEEHMTFAFALCDDCEHLGQIAGMMAVPGEVFFEKVAQAQLEQFGKMLSPTELTRALDDVNNPLSKLAREAPKGR